jgi:hypothetical protein
VEREVLDEQGTCGQYISNRKKGGEKRQRENLSDILSPNLKRESRKDAEAL